VRRVGLGVLALDGAEVFLAVFFFVPMRMQQTIDRRVP
jgi:hypothetical protein